MRSDSTDDGTQPDPAAETRAIVEETQRAIAASRTIRDSRATLAAAGEAADEPGPCGDRTDVLGEISEGLIHAYRYAARDGDPLTVTLIERALFHVGRRLAHGMSPADAGLNCH